MIGAKTGIYASQFKAAPVGDYAIRIIGPNTYIRTTSQIPLSVTYTINTRIYLESNSVNGMLFGGVGTNNYVQITQSGLNWRIRCSDVTSNNDFFIPVASFPINTWGNFTFVVDANQLSFYFDGAKIGSTVSFTGQFPFDYIGVWNLLSIYLSETRINDTGVLNGTAASLGQISDLASGQNFITVMGSADIYYEYNQNSGTIVNDSSVNNNKGVINGPNFDWVLV